MVQVAGGTINGSANTTPYTSLALASGTVNITPLTDLLVANVVGTAPSAWFTVATATPSVLSSVTQAKLDTALSKVSAVLNGLPLSSNNPITTVFTASSGNTSDDMLTALSKTMTSTGVPFAALQAIAASGSSSPPYPAFGTALATSYLGTTSGGGTTNSTGASNSGSSASGTTNSVSTSTTPAPYTITEYSVGSGGFKPTYKIAAGPDGNLWFTEGTSNNRIGRITPAGVVTEFSTGITSGPWLGITAGPDGNIWFTEYAGGKIGRITPSGDVTEFSAGITATAAPASITAGPDGNLWFTEQNTGGIGRITPAGVITEFKNIYAGVITAGPDGNLWYTTGRSIGRITPAGVTTGFTTGISGTPDAITAGPDGNIWFTEHLDNLNNLIGRITPAGVVTEFSAGISGKTIKSSVDGSFSAMFWSITTGPDGNLWFPEESSNVIGRITPSGVVTEFSTGLSPNAGPEGIAAGPDGNIWFAEVHQGSGQIGKLTLK